MGLEAAAIAAIPILIGATAWTGYTQYRSAEEAKEQAEKTARRQEALAREERTHREMEERQAAMQFLRRRQRAVTAMQSPGSLLDSATIATMMGMGTLGGSSQGGKHLLGQ